MNPIPLAGEVGPNGLLGNVLYGYRHYHKQGSSLDATLPERYVRVGNDRPKADHVIWVGLGRMPLERELIHFSVKPTSL